MAGLRSTAAHRAVVGVLGFVVTLTASAGLPTSASAFCGFYVAGADAELYNNATMVVMMREGTRTVLAMQNNYQGPPENFAMVVPVPVVLQEENVKTLEREIFQRVDHLAAPRLVEYWEQDPCEMARLERMREEEGQMLASPTSSAADGSGRGVTIEAQFTVGEYEIVILSANDSTGLDTWLRENGYRIPEGAAPILRPYVEAGMKFFVAKVDSTKVRFENGQAMLSPLRFHYDSEDFSLPVRLGLLNSGGTQDLIAHILAPNQRFEVANYPNVTIPTNLDVADEVRNRFGEFYASLFDATVERNPRAVVTEYAWQATNCDPCPGPVLSESDLMTLGADVLPGTRSNRTANVVVMMPTIEGPLPADLVQMILQRSVRQLTSCYQAGLDQNTGLNGRVDMSFTIGADGRVSDPAARPQGATDPTVLACMATELRGMRFPPPNDDQPARVQVGVVLNATDSGPWEQMQRMQSFVLTRLHARYSKEALGDDLIFRPAPPIVGGREFPGPSGKMEQGAREASANNFQGRYAIRHAWTGAVACDNPVRGVWGGPPSGTPRTDVRPATDLAFAPRGNLSLADMVRQNVPELELSATTVTEVPHRILGGSTGSGSGRASQGCGACTVGHGSSSAGAGGLCAVLLSLTLLRRRRRGASTGR